MSRWRRASMEARPDQVAASLYELGQLQHITCTYDCLHACMIAFLCVCVCTRVRMHVCMHACMALDDSVKLPQPTPASLPGTTASQHLHSQPLPLSSPLTARSHQTRCQPLSVKPDPRLLGLPPPRLAAQFPSILACPPQPQLPRPGPGIVSQSLEPTPQASMMTGRPPRQC